MRVSENGLALIKDFEGLRLGAYQDQKSVWTIGYGTTRGVTASMTITEPQAFQFLMRDATATAEALSTEITTDVSQNEFDALVSFSYNVGLTAFRGSTMRRLINAGNFAAAAAEFPKWDHIGPNVSQGLLSRRQRERALFETA